MNASSCVHASRLASWSIRIALATRATKNSPACRPTRTPWSSAELGSACAAIFWIARAACPARRGASSIGSSPNTATSPRGLTSSTWPPKLWTFSTRVSSTVAASDIVLTDDDITRSARSRATCRRCHCNVGGLGAVAGSTVEFIGPAGVVGSAVPAGGRSPYFCRR